MADLSEPYLILFGRVSSRVSVRCRFVPVMTLRARSVARQLSLVILLIGASTVLVVAGIARAISPDVSQLAALIGASAVIFTFAVWYASRRLVSGPIQSLAAAISDVSASQDYTTRVEQHTKNGDVGLLVDNVNELLSGIEEHARRVQEEHGRSVRNEDALREEAILNRTREFLESNQRLEAAVARAEERATQAIDSNNAMNQAISETTHELRTPMNGVMGMATLLLNTDLTPQQHEYARTVLESAEDLLSLVNNVLDFSKVEAGQLDRIDSEPCSPGSCVEKISQLLVARAEMKGLALSSECSDDVPRAILGDGKRLRQVLINVIGNAIKFTETGSIAIRTALIEQVDDVSTIRFEVVDTGIGVPDHLHEHIFERFSQADRSTTRQFGGAGLGLTISKHLVELMGCEIGLISRPGVGSNFWFTIKGEHRRPASETDCDLGGVRALVVATGAGRDALRDQLASFRAEDVDVPNPERALAALQSEAFDVILIDAQLQDGLLLARRFGPREVRKSVPLVLMSNVERRKDELEEAGIDGWLKRPVEDRELFACVARLTGRLDVVLPAEDEEVSSEADADLAGAHILVADDHSVNRKITVTLVEALECRADVAVDGAEVIDAVQREHYDLVLLDCQMPDIDGYEAAREIRRLEEQGRVTSQGSLGHLPIVALTAHTSPADRDRCVQSGMDDFVSKPFTRQTLRGVLRKWVAGRDGPGAVPAFSAATTNPRPSPEDDAPINETAIEEILELDRLRGGGVFAPFAEGFLEAVPITLEKLRTAVREDDAAGIGRSAHALNGASLNIGADHVAAASRELEALVENGSTEGASALAARIDDLYVAVKSALEARLARSRRDDAVTAG